MNEAVKVAGFAIVAALAAFSLRAVHAPAGAMVAIAAGLTLFTAAVTHLAPAADMLQSLSQKAGVGDGTAALLIKLVGMAYLTEFAAQACHDAGEDGLAAKAALCGKTLLLLQTLPLLQEIGEMALSLVP